MQPEMRPATQWLDQFASLVRSCRHQGGWTIRGVCESARVSRGVIERIEKESWRGDFDFHHLERVLTALGVAIEARVGGEDRARLQPERLIPAERLRRGLSRRRLAELAGVSSTAIDRFRPSGGAG